MKTDVKWGSVTSGHSILALCEIGAIEDAHQFNLPSLGAAWRQLMRRWTVGLRDEETFLRLVFLRWYSIADGQAERSGLDADLMGTTIDELIEDYGGESRFSAEVYFVLGYLAHLVDHGVGDPDEWRRRSPSYLGCASERAPKSPLFGMWTMLIGDTKSFKGLRQDARSELHARFKGRGAMGRYLIHVLGGVLDEAYSVAPRR